MSDTKDYVIKVNGVSKDYGKAHVLDDMSFTVPCLDPKASSTFSMG